MNQNQEIKKNSVNASANETAQENRAGQTITADAAQIGGWSIDSGAISRTFTMPNGAQYLLSLYAAGNHLLALGPPNSETKYLITADGVTEAEGALLKYVQASALLSDAGEASPQAPFFVRCVTEEGNPNNTAALRFAVADPQADGCQASFAPFTDSAAKIDLGADALPFQNAYCCGVFLKELEPGSTQGGVRKTAQLNNQGLFYFKQDTSGEEPVLFSIIREGGTYTPGLISAYYKSGDHPLLFRVDPEVGLSGYAAADKARKVFLDFKNGNATFSGKVTCQSLVQTSDARLKKNVETMDKQRAHDFIMALRPTTFAWENGEDNARHAGFLAQEVGKAQKTLGVQAASETEMPLPQQDAKPAADTLRTQWTLDYTAILSPLVSVVQAQQKTIESIQARLDDLEKRLDA